MKVTPRALLVSALLVVGLSVWGWWTGLARVRETRGTLRELRARYAELERGNRALAREVEALRREPVSRQRAARELIGVASPEEVVVLLPTPSVTPTPAPAPPPREEAGKAGGGLV